MTSNMVLNTIILGDFFEPFIEPVRWALLKLQCDQLLPFSAVIALCLYFLIAGVIKFTIKQLTKYSHKKTEIDSAIDLHPKFTAAELHEYTSNYVESKFQLSSPYKEVSANRRKRDLEAERVNSTPKTVILVNDQRHSLLSFFINKSFKKNRWADNLIDRLIKTFPSAPFNTNLKQLSQRQFYFLLGDTGTGKTAFMLNLFLRYTKMLMRDFSIEIFLLKDPHLEDQISKIPNKKDTILLLDALDEDEKAFSNPQKRIAELVVLTREFRKVIITCRIQFFSNEKDEPFEIELKRHSDIGIDQFGKMYLSPFGDQEIAQFIKKTYKNRAFRNQATRLVRQIPDVVVRPMVLRHLDDLISGGRTIERKLDMYDIIVDNWVEREKYNVEPTKRPNFRQNILRFSEEIAVHIYNNPIDNELVILSDDIDRYAEQNDIILSCLELKARSLLNSGEDNQYKFSHKAYLEYFLAQNLYYNDDFRSGFNVRGFDAAFSFYKERCIRDHTIPFFRSLTHFDLEKIPATDKANVIGQLHHKTGIPRAKLDVLIWRLRVKDDYEFQWVFLKEIHTMDVPKPEYPHWDKVMQGIGGSRAFK